VEGVDADGAGGVLVVHAEPAEGFHEGVKVGAAVLAVLAVTEAELAEKSIPLALLLQAKIVDEVLGMLLLLAVGFSAMIHCLSK
jgi:hypothetical protein